MSDSVPPTGDGERRIRPSMRPGGAESLIGTTIGDRYRIDSILGEGGMGTVYAAEHALMRKKVALKVLHPEMSRVPDVVARFEREALAAGHIDHPNIAAATDFGKLADGSFFLVLELIVGDNLNDVIARGPMEPARAVHIATQIAGALDRAHGLGVVHRDLKPDNVMLVARGTDLDFVKILDFGIAKVPMFEPSEQPASAIPSSGSPRVLTQAGMVYGTPAYMAPEQALGQPIDGRADLYAVGIVLFEMLTGSRPFKHDNMATLLGLQVTGPVPSMSDVAPSVTVSSPLEAIVRRLLAKDPADRFATAAELEAALVHSTAMTLPGDPPPPDAAEKAPKTISLARAPATTAVATARTEVALPPPAPPPAAPLPTRRNRWVIAPASATILGVVVLAMFSRAPPPQVPANASPPPLAVSVPSPASAATSAPVVPPAAPPVVEPPDATPEDPLAPALAAAGAALAKNDANGALAALAPVQAANPRRGDLQRLLERAHVLLHDRAAAVRDADAWLSIDPSAAADLSLQGDVGEIATHPATSEAAIALLASRMGAPGVDILYDLAYTSKQKASVVSRAVAALAQPDVRSHAGPSAGVLLDLRAATTCEARRALLGRTKTDGDRRALLILKPWTVPKKENACMKHDAELTSAISAVSGRTGML